MRLTLCEAPTRETRPDHHRGGSRIFFRRGCTRLLLYFNTNKPLSFFFAVVLENRRSSQGEEGVRTPCTLPLDPPLLYAGNSGNSMPYSLRRVRGFFNVPRWPYNTEDAVYGAYDLSSLSEKTRTSFHLQMSLQRQHVKTLSVSPVWGSNRDLPHSSPALYQLS